jgi:thioesterase domain-containing protein
MNLDPVIFAAATYDPKPYPSPVALFQAVERPSGKHWDLRYVWETLIRGPFESHDIVGGHDGMFKEPYVAALGSKLQNSLEQAQKLCSEEGQSAVRRFNYRAPSAEIPRAVELGPR